MSNVKTVVPLRGIRGMVADKMVKSLQEAAQLTHHATCDATALFARKQELENAAAIQPSETRESDQSRQIKVSIEDLLMEAVVNTLKRHPRINGVVNGREIHLQEDINLSVAIALPDNLLVAPTIFSADKLDIQQLRASRRDLVRRALANELSVREMTGGTFTVSNLGLSRVEYFTPILNSPQIGILGVGCVQTKPLYCDGQLEYRPCIGLSLTFDHRAIDGAPAAAFLTDLCNTIEG